MFSISVLAQCCHMGPNPVHQQLALRWFCHINHLLNNIVCKLILHHSIQGTKHKKSCQELNINVFSQSSKSTESYYCSSDYRDALSSIGQGLHHLSIIIQHMMIVVRALNFKMVALHFVSVTEEVKIAIEIQFQGVQKMLLSLTYHFSKYMLSFCLLN